MLEDSNPIMEDPRFWVAIAFFVFVVLAYRKVSKLLIGTLDARTAKIKTELEEAQRLRNEAHAVLEEYKQKQTEYLKEAEAILACAMEDAASLRALGENELKTTLDSRMKSAVDRIAQEESNAIAEVRNHVVDIALASARSLIIEHVSNLPTDELITLALTDIEHKIH